MKIDKKTAKLFTFAMIVWGATAIYLYFSGKNKNKENPLPPSPPSNEVYKNGVVKTNTSDLNVREEPNITSKIVSKLKKIGHIMKTSNVLVK